MSEGQFQKLVVDFARVHQWRCAHFKPAFVPQKGGKRRYITRVAYDGAGWPDLVLVKTGRIVFAELKAENGTATHDQSLWLDRLASAGGTLGVNAAGESILSPVEVYLWRPSSWPEIERVLGGPS